MVGFYNLNNKEMILEIDYDNKIIRLTGPVKWLELASKIEEIRRGEEDWYVSIPDNKPCFTLPYAPAPFQPYYDADSWKVTCNG